MSSCPKELAKFSTPERAVPKPVYGTDTAIRPCNTQPLRTRCSSSSSSSQLFYTAHLTLTIRSPVFEISGGKTSISDCDATESHSRSTNSAFLTESSLDSRGNKYWHLSTVHISIQWKVYRTVLCHHYCSMIDKMKMPRALPTANLHFPVLHCVVKCILAIVAEVLSVVVQNFKRSESNRYAAKQHYRYLAVVSATYTPTHWPTNTRNNQADRIVIAAIVQQAIKSIDCNWMTML